MTLLLTSVGSVLASLVLVVTSGARAVLTSAVRDCGPPPPVSPPPPLSPTTLLALALCLVRVPASSGSTDSLDRTKL